jgi:predicted dehydrogenase
MASEVAPWKTAALIGGGRMGRSHAQALREMGVSLTVVCDVRGEALAAIGDEFGVAPDMRFQNAAEMFTRLGKVDVVSIATTADTHCDMVLLAASAGAGSILCEKPLATSVADCDRMIAACAASGTRLAVNHQMRFMDQYRLVKAELKSGALGRLASMNVVAGCFGLAMNGSHYIEAFSYLTEAKPVEASAWFSGESIRNPRGPAFFDQAGEMRIVTDTGQRLNFAIGADQGHGMTVTYAGAFGHIFVDELEGEIIATTRLPEHRDVPANRYGMPWERRNIRFPAADNTGTTRAVLQALASDSDYPTGEDARRVIATLVACYASAENGNKPYRIDGLGRLAERHFPWA